MAIPEEPLGSCERTRVGRLEDEVLFLEGISDWMTTTSMSIKDESEKMWVWAKERKQVRYKWGEKSDRQSD